MGLFDWFRRKDPAPPEPRDASHASGASSATSVVAVVLLREAVQADGQAVMSHLRGQGAQCEMFLRITGLIEKPGVLVGSIPGGTVKILSRPTPIPQQELERPVARAWHWPTAREEVGAHQGHVIVHASSTPAHLINLWRLQARLVAAVVVTTPALGVYVPDAVMVRSRDDWLDEALTTEGDDFSLLLWVGINPVREADGRVSAYTTGMSSFGIMELEVWASTRPFEEVMDRLLDAIDHQAGTDKRLGDGEMFGFPPEDRHPVRHRPSRFFPGTRVAVLEGG